MKRLAVFFPGIGYHCDKPLLYYGRKIAAECGYADQIKVEYSYDGRNIKGDREKMREVFFSLYDKAQKALKDVDFAEYDRVLFVSKSVGTAISARYAMERGLECKNVIYTPVEQTFDFTINKAIAFTGTSDPWADTDIIKEKSTSQNIPISIYVGANHSLETEDSIDNLKIMIDVMDKTRRFIMG